MDPYGPWWTPDEAPNEPPADPHKPLHNGLFMEPQSNALFDLAFFYGLDKFLIKDQQKLTIIWKATSKLPWPHCIEVDTT